MGRNGQKSRQYVACGSCRGWTCEDKLRRARGGRRCWEWLGHSHTQPGARQQPASTPPWRSGPTPREAKWGFTTKACLEFLTKNASYGDKIAELAKQATQEEEAAPHPPPTSARQRLQSAQGRHAHQQEILDQAHSALHEAEAVRAAAEQYYEEVLEQALAVPKELEEVLQGDLEEYEDGPIKDEIQGFRDQVREAQRQGREALAARQLEREAMEKAAAEAAQRHRETDAKLHAQAEAHQKMSLEHAEQVRTRIPAPQKKRKVDREGAAAAGAEANNADATAAAAWALKGPPAPAANASPEEIQKHKEELAAFRERAKQEHA
ncbi:unnamed protein product [Prorocentrum cordatum]|uniref:Uncharacterized protein n=1 Tax=Prorocentrum cordatum TaxID=2364126 RepID=A0ABN9XDN7_9DINO|nr:unnamed protein product [Polarella glacialis]